VLRGMIYDIVKPGKTDLRQSQCVFDYLTI
jgi:hypothetical protein